MKIIILVVLALIVGLFIKNNKKESLTTEVMVVPTVNEGIVKQPAQEVIAEAIENNVKPVVEGVIEIKEAAFKDTQEAKDAIVEGITEVKGAIEEKVLEVKEQVVEGITEAKETVAEATAEVKEQVAEGVTEAKETVAEVVEAVLEGATQEAVIPQPVVNQ